jgi:hypothetical protein
MIEYIIVNVPEHNIPSTEVDPSEGIILVKYQEEIIGSVVPTDDGYALHTLFENSSMYDCLEEIIARYKQYEFVYITD